ncbi:hypothetical protein M3J09_012772 [Ascochyta lentis]
MLECPSNHQRMWLSVTMAHCCVPFHSDKVVAPLR